MKYTSFIFPILVIAITTKTKVRNDPRDITFGYRTCLSKMLLLEEIEKLQFGECPTKSRVKV